MSADVHYEQGQRVTIFGERFGTVIDGPHEDWNGAYRVAIDGDGLNYVAPFAMLAILPVVSDSTEDPSP